MTRNAHARLFHFSRHFIGLAAILVCFLLASVQTFAAEPIPATHVFQNHMPNFWAWYDLSEYDKVPVGTPVRYAYDGDVIEYKKNPPANYPKNKSNPLPHDDLQMYYQHFGRIGAYHSWPLTAAKAMEQAFPEGQVHVAMSGAVINNVHSLNQRGNAAGYDNPAWGDRWRSAYAGLQKADGRRILDMVHQTGHHTMGPLVGNSYLVKDMIYQNVTMAQPSFLGTDFRSSRGFVPSGLGFSERMIPALKKMGVGWSLVANHHFSRALKNYPAELLHQPGEDSYISPPNRADFQNPAVDGEWVRQIMQNQMPLIRNHYPFAATPHWVKYVDPLTGEEQRIAGIPSDEIASWESAYQGTISGGFLKKYDGMLKQKPYFVVYQDGDLTSGRAATEAAWHSGINVTYKEPGFTGMGVDEYLRRYPLADDNVAHIQDGGWIHTLDSVSDPQMLHWKLPFGIWKSQMAALNRTMGLNLQPKLNLNGQTEGMSVSMEYGYHYLERNFALLQAAMNYAETAEQIWLDDHPDHWQPRTTLDREVTHPGNQLNPWMMSYPVKGDPANDYAGGANPAELAWYFLLPAMDASFGYYDENIDDNIKPTLSFNQSLHFSDSYVKSRLAKDRTGPSVWWPQRWPYNPGSANKDKSQGWTAQFYNHKFVIYTYAFDVNEIAGIKLRIRRHTDRSVDVSDNTFRVYDPAALQAKGVKGIDAATVGTWVDYPMMRRDLDPEMNGVPWQTYPAQLLPSTVMPAKQTGDLYFTYLDHFRDEMIDYYIEAVDSKGNVTRTDIQQVYVGAGTYEKGGTAGFMENPAGAYQGTDPFLTRGMSRPVISWAPTFDSGTGLPVPTPVPTYPPDLLPVTPGPTMVPTAIPTATPVVTSTPVITPMPTPTSPPWTPAPQPLLTNGSFEDATIRGWTAWQPDGQRAAYGVDRNDAADGNFKLYFWGTSDFQQSVHQIVNVPNGIYQLTARIKLTAYGAKPLVARLELGATGGPDLYTNCLSDGKWTTYTAQAQVTSGKIDAGIYLNAKAYTSMQIDGVRLELISGGGPTVPPAATPTVVPTATPVVTPTVTPVVTPTVTPFVTGTPSPFVTAMPTSPPIAGENLFVNAGFESGRLDGWYEWHPSGQSPAWGIDGQDVYAGKAKAYFWSAKPYKQSIHQIRSGLADGWYELSAAVKLQVFGQAPAVARMEALDYGGAPMYQNLTADGRWQQLKMQVPVTAGKIDLGFYVDSPGWTSLQIDEAALRRMQPVSQAGPLGGDLREDTVYFVVTARFADGDPSNNRSDRTSLKNGIASADDPVFRGDFKGLIAKLDYIKALGFSAIQLTPVVLNRGETDFHGYAGYDFYRIDGRLTSESATYQHLIDEAHQRGIKVIQEIVLNHSSVWGAKGLGTAKAFGIRDAQWNWYYDLNDPSFTYDGVTRHPQSGLADHTGDLWSEVQPAGNQCPNWGKPTGYRTVEGHTLYHCQFPGATNQLLPDEYYHRCELGFFAGEDYRSCWVRKDAADFNTEHPVVQQYLIGAYRKFIDMGVDGFKIHAAGHVPRTTLNRVFIPAFRDYAVSRWGEKGKSFFLAGEAGMFSKGKWFDQNVNLSAPFFTWQERQTYSSDDAQASLEMYQWENKQGPSGQPKSFNAFLNGNAYRPPVAQGFSGMHIQDLRTQMNFTNAGNAFVQGKDSDDAVHDATHQLVSLDTYSYGGGQSSNRYMGSMDAFAENFTLMWTFRGIPMLYYGSEVMFQAGKPVGCASPCPLGETSNAYFGDRISGEVRAEAFGRATYADGNAAKTLQSPLVQHVQRLNQIRRQIPALQKGQYATEGVSGAIAFKRRYTDAVTDSFVLVAVSGEAIFRGIPNGVYVDAVTGERRTVTDGTMQVQAGGTGNARIFVLDLPGQPAPGKIGTDGLYLK